MIIPNREQLQEQLPREQYQELVELYGALGKPSTEHRSSWGPELRRSYGRLLQQNLLSLADVPHTIVEIVDRILDGGDFHLAAFIMAATARHQANNSLPDSRAPLVQSGSATVYEAALTHKLPVTLAFDSPYEPVQVIQSIARLRYKRASAAVFYLNTATRVSSTAYWNAKSLDDVASRLETYVCENGGT